MTPLIRLIEFYKYLFVGIGNTFFGYLLFAFFLYTGSHYSIAVLLSTVLGIFFNFYMYGKIVFKSISKNLLIRFVFAYTVLYLINVILLSISDYFEFNMYISGIVVLSITAAFGFIFNKRYVWQKN